MNGFYDSADLAKLTCGACNWIDWYTTVDGKKDHEDRKALHRCEVCKCETSFEHPACAYFNGHG